MHCIRLLATVVGLCLCLACSKDSPEVIESSGRTVLVYVVGENSLSGNVSRDINEMLAACADCGDGRLVIYVDDVGLPRMYVVDKHTKERQMSNLTPVKVWSEDVNSASSEFFAEVVDETMRRWPAQSYGLVMWSHASGWVPSTYVGDRNARKRSFGIDNGCNDRYSNWGNQMEIADMVAALDGKALFDFIFFDACFMQCVEVAYELRHVTKSVVASPAEIPGPGANYKTMVGAMMAKDDCVGQILSAYYEEYKSLSAGYGVVISAIETAELEGLAEKMRSIVARHGEDLSTVNMSGLLRYHKYGEWSRSMPDYVDMQGWMRQVLNDDEYAEWKMLVDKAVRCKYTDVWYSAYVRDMCSVDSSQCCGMTMYVPRVAYEGTSFYEAFPQTDWAKRVWE